MASPLILQFALFIIVTVHLVNADYCEGEYTTNEEDVFKGIDNDLREDSLAVRGE